MSELAPIAWPRKRMLVLLLGIALIAAASWFAVPHILSLSEPIDESRYDKHALVELVQFFRVIEGLFVFVVGFKIAGVGIALAGWALFGSRWRRTMQNI